MSERAQLKQLVGMPAREPPKEIRIFKTGKVETTKGTFLFDDKAGKSVMAAWESYGNDLMLDYEHMSVNPDGRAGDGKAAGWFKLELRPDGLYAVDIKWTQQAANQIAAAEWRYFSPTFDFDKKSGRILELVNVALTNIPATKNLPALVAASKDNKMATKSVAAKAAKEPKMASKTAEELAAAKLASKQLGFKKTKKTMETTEEETADEVEADDAELEETDDADTDDADLEEADDAELEEADEASADFGDDSDDDDDAESDDDSDGSGDSAKKKMKKTSRISERAALATLREITGKSDLSEAVGVMRAFRISQDKVETLSKQVDELRKDRRRALVKSMIENACKAGKLLPAQREAFTKIGLRDSKELKALLDTMPKRVNTVGSEARPDDSAVGSKELSREERRIAGRAGCDVSAYTQAKAEGKLLSLDAFLGFDDDN